MKIIIAILVLGIISQVKSEGEEIDFFLNKAKNIIN